MITQCRYHCAYVFLWPDESIIKIGLCTTKNINTHIYLGRCAFLQFNIESLFLRKTFFAVNPQMLSEITEKVTRWGRTKEEEILAISMTFLITASHASPRIMPFVHTLIFVLPSFFHLFNFLNTLWSPAFPQVLLWPWDPHTVHLWLPFGQGLIPLFSGQIVSVDYFQHLTI